MLAPYGGGRRRAMIQAGGRMARRAAPGFAMGIGAAEAGRIARGAVDMAKYAYQSLAGKKERKRRPPPKQAPRERKVVAPVAIAGSIRSRPARFQSKQGHFRVQHREMMTEIKSTGGDNMDVFTTNLNPGILPWCAAMADAWDKYRFHSVKFQFEPTVATSAVGNFYMAFDGPMKDVLPETPGDLMTLENASVDRIWTPSTFKVPSRHLGKRRLVRDSALAGKEPMDYDAGRLVFGVSGAAAGVIGALYIEYDVEFFEPSSSVAIAPSTSVTCMVVTPATSLVTSTYNEPTFMDHNLNDVDGLSLGAAGNITADGITLAPGTYAVTAQARFTQDCDIASISFLTGIGVEGKNAYPTVAWYAGSPNPFDREVDTFRVVHITQPTKINVSVRAVFSSGSVTLQQVKLMVIALA